ncbi:hypothetical protein [Mucilaginibacter ginkgonis]|uniref:Uncharacterized protein n=1 Tax=Mucilaginibacter ginkgonis TaxID=2682091 RepID=A0A6I4HZZ8_9SPHI|nr:hypothetical protein [Mucilaginibacter ginkgonis]QQL49949.1 hypothetical protein GO620_000420 [Mucilaginibacter ginkgonis]
MKFIIICGLCFFYVAAHCQITTGVHNIPHAQNLNAIRDTVIESDTTKENKEPQYFYATLSTTAFVNTKGSFANRFVPSIEFGRTYGIFDIGMATGKTNTLANGSDTTHFIELRPTINIFSKGRFAEGLCLGAGYIFGAKQALMTEICNSINFNLTEIFALAIVQGYEFFDGTNSNTNRQYMGFTFTYNFLKKHSTNLRRKRAALISDK